MDGPLETAPTAPGGAARCRSRLVRSLTAGRCHVGGGAIVDGAPSVSEKDTTASPSSIPRGAAPVGYRMTPRCGYATGWR